MRALLIETVTLGILVFDDPACAAAFPAGDVTAERFDELARCLTTLKLRASERVDALGDVVVMSYGAGFEVQARVLVQGEVAALTWIGAATAYAGSSTAPTLDPPAFEALRTSGQRVPVLPPDIAKTLEADLQGPDDAARVWLKICLDESGAVVRTEPFEPTSYAAMAFFTEIAKTWTFKPFVHAGAPRPVCSTVRMSYPASTEPEVLPLPPPPSHAGRPPLFFPANRFSTLMEGKRTQGTKIIVPDDRTKTQIARTSQSGQARVMGAYRLCLDTAGNAESVVPLTVTGFPAYDQKIMAEVNQWKYSPYLIDGQPVPVCTVVRFIYQQR